MANGPVTAALIKALEQSSHELISENVIDAIVAAFRQSTYELIDENIIESVGCSLAGKPVKMTLYLTFEEDAHGLYQLESKIAFGGCRITKSRKQTHDFRSLQKPSKFSSRGTAAITAAAA